MLSFASTINVVFAGNQNMNGGHGIQGTGKLNGKEGCRPNIQTGNFMVNMDISPEELAAINAMLASTPNPNGSWWQINSIDWMGGPCCPSNELAANGNPLPNQCCNGPDMGPPGSGVPGNHCECFELRGYPFPYAADLISP